MKQLRKFSPSTALKPFLARNNANQLPFFLMYVEFVTKPKQYKHRTSEIVAENKKDRIILMLSVRGAHKDKKQLVQPRLLMLPRRIGE